MNDAFQRAGRKKKVISVEKKKIRGGKVTKFNWLNYPTFFHFLINLRMIRAVVSEKWEKKIQTLNLYLNGENHRTNQPTNDQFRRAGRKKKEKNFSSEVK